MHRSLPTFPQIEGHIQSAPLPYGIRWGFIGGFAGTLVMDLFLMGVFVSVQLPPLLCFSIVGDTMARFFSIMGIELAGGVLPGIATHYVVGPIFGILYGAAVAIAPARYKSTRRKCVMASLLYVEILSQPLLATAPILLKMTTREILQWYAGGFVMHLLMGAVLGLVVAYGLRCWSEGAFASSPNPPFLATFRKGWRSLESCVEAKLR
jgi:hypothetical protein